MKAALAKFVMIYPVHLLRGEMVPFFIREIASVERLSADGLFKYQEKKLSHLLQRCYEIDPYYRRILERLGAQKSLARPSEFFHDLPFLTKNIVREEESFRKHHFWQGLDSRSTSGSTGTPFTFFKNRRSTGYMEAVQNHAYSWYGIPVGTPQGRFWGMPTGGQRKLACIKDFLKNRIRFSAFDLSDDAKESFFEKLCRFKPGYLYGYPTLLLEFARSIGHTRLSNADIPLIAVIGTGESVTPGERQELSQLFGVPFVGEYGCTETGVIGFDCPHGNMHLMASNVMLEVIDPNGSPLAPGQEGEIVVTELNAGYFPFIRYRIGDRGRLTEGYCSCGLTLPTFEVLAGRRDDYILTPDGRKVYDAILAYILKDGVRQFQGVQENLNCLRILVCSDGSFTEEHEKRYVASLQEALGPEMNVRIEKVLEIPREKSGKLRYFRSEIGRITNDGR